METTMTTHQIVAIGDLHLQEGNARNAARLRAFDDIIKAGLALPNLAAWLQLGDVFHTRSTAADRNAFAERLLRMAGVAPVVVVRGNHCVPGDLEIFDKLATAWPVRVVTTPETVYVDLATDGRAAIACCPYPSRAGLIASGTDASTTLGAGQAALESIFRGLGLNLVVAAEKGYLPLFIGHLNIAGARASSGQPSIGVELEADGAMLDLLGDVPKLLGHIHAPQEIGGAHYVGSVCRMDFGETEEKRYIVVEYEEAA
jgi:hypothetical protein